MVLLGPPGAGKGTQAALLAQSIDAQHISTGDLFRHHVSRETELGIVVKALLDRGELVPDDLTFRLVVDTLDNLGPTSGLILDGFPRSLAQARMLDDHLDANGQVLDAVLCFDVDDATVVERMLARGRGDDSAEVIRRRLDLYRQETEPLLKYYGEQSLLVHIDAIGTVEEVCARALGALGVVDETAQPI